MKSRNVLFTLVLLAVGSLSGCAFLLPLVPADDGVVQKDHLTLARIPYPGADGTPRLSGAEHVTGGRVSTIDYDSAATRGQIHEALDTHFRKAGFRQVFQDAAAGVYRYQRSNRQAGSTRIELLVRENNRAGTRKVRIEMFVPTDADLADR